MQDSDFDKGDVEVMFMGQSWLGCPVTNLQFWLSEFVEVGKQSVIGCWRACGERNNNNNNKRQNSVMVVRWNFFFFHFWSRVSCSSVWSWIHCVAKVDLELSELSDPPDSTSPELALQKCTTALRPHTEASCLLGIHPTKQATSPALSSTFLLENLTHS